MPGDASGPLKVLADIRDVLVSILGALENQEKHAEGESAHERPEGEPHEQAGSSPLDDFRAEFAAKLKAGLEAGAQARSGTKDEAGSGGGGSSRWNATGNLLSASGLGELAGAIQKFKGFVDAFTNFQATFLGAGQQRPQPALEPYAPRLQTPTVSMPTSPWQAQEHRPPIVPTLPSPASLTPQVKPLPMENPFLHREEHKQPTATVPAVVPVTGAAPTANLIASPTPVEMQTGPNLSRAVPTAGVRPLGLGVPTTLGGFPGLGQTGALPMTQPILGGGLAGAGRQGGGAGGGGGGGGAEMMAAVNSLSQSAGNLAEAARRRDKVELSDRFRGAGMTGLLESSGGAGVQDEPGSIFDALPDAPGISEEHGTSRTVTIHDSDHTSAIRRWR